MKNLENFLKNNIFFTYQREDDYYVEQGYSECFVINSIYKSKIIHNPTKFNLTTTNKLVDKVKPFLSCLTSKYIWKKSNCNFNVGSFNISLIVGVFYSSNLEEESEYNEIANLIVDDYMRELKYVGNNTYTNKIFKKPFQIHIDVNVEYFPEEEDEEEEEEGEEKPITVIESFREDKCVVCLINEPRVLFYDCMHYCVCLECEEIKPFKSCPYCRIRISTKII